VAFKRRTFAESDDQLQMFAPGGGQDRLYRVSSFQLQAVRREGARSDAEPRAHLHVPSLGARGQPGRVTLRQGDHWVAGQARYRRPVTAEDVNELLRYYEDGSKAGGVRGRRPQRRHRDVGQSVLPVPRRTPAGGGAAGRHLRDHESRAGVEAVVLPVELDPDDELVQLGTAGRLSAPSVLDRQVRRMLADPRSVTLADNFVPQWLDMKRLDEIVRTPRCCRMPPVVRPARDFRTELALFAGTASSGRIAASLICCAPGTRI